MILANFLVFLESFAGESFEFKCKMKKHISNINPFVPNAP